MEFISPMPFREAVDKLGSQSVLASELSAGEWRDLPLELRDNAFFSSRVESAHFLQRAQDSLGDFLAGNRVETEKGQFMLATGSRAAFVSQMQDFLEGEGVVRGKGGITDITSQARQGLIFDVKTRQAQDFGYWKQGMNPAVLNEFPAQRFIRVRDVKTEREWHIPYQDQVYLKTDPIWSLEINRDFGVPWGPWGWGCGHDVEDVDRDETEHLGLLKPGQRLQPLQRSLNNNLQAGIARMDPDLVQKLKDVFGERIVVEGGTMRWRGQPGDAAPGDRATDEERRALNGYTRSEYRAINSGLRAGDVSAFINNRADLITQALAKLKPYVGTVYRGTFVSTEKLRSYLSGNVITEKAFTSATRDEGQTFNGNVLFTIQSKNGKRVARYSSHKSEAEVLFDQGTQFRILRRAFEDGTWQITLEEL